MSINKPWSEISMKEKVVIVEELLNGIRDGLMNNDVMTVQVDYNVGLPPHNYGRDKIFIYNATDTITIEIGRVKKIKSQ